MIEGLAPGRGRGWPLFEELLPNALSEYVVLKERTKVFDAATLINTVLFTWGDTISDLVVTVQLVLAASKFAVPMI